ncbi:toxin co-regulated pilus biosynthesis Q family protein [Leptospirillum ferriphilum]|uniref:toxin co-regulated pilus biosynthesis Q family protein n=1 Tax=Leptospirillum ferriphilum TaxID=178606 RepID=UPI0006B16595|nr:toxin co-regulated pilus biosynthesis Q family protein [Leptospirillum ferriphilum]
MNKRMTLFLALSFLLVPVSRQADAYFCGDPLTDNCSVPTVHAKGPSSETSVRQENHPTMTFVLVPGKSLKDNFESWGDQAGWKVVWKSEYTFPVMARFVAGRTFLGAVRRAIRVFDGSSGGWIRAHAFMANHVLIVEDGR